MILMIIGTQTLRFRDPQPELGAPPRVAGLAAGSFFLPIPECGGRIKQYSSHGAAS
jgi:hypothetical protein